MWWVNKEFFFFWVVLFFVRKELSVSTGWRASASGFGFGFCGLCLPRIECAFTCRLFRKSEKAKVTSNHQKNRTKWKSIVFVEYFELVLLAHRRSESRNATAHSNLRHLRFKSVFCVVFVSTPFWNDFEWFFVLVFCEMIWSKWFAPGLTSWVDTNLWFE